MDFFGNFQLVCNLLFSGLNLEKSSSALSLKRTTKGFEGGLSLCSVSEGKGIFTHLLEELLKDIIHSA